MAARQIKINELKVSVKMPDASEKMPGAHH